MSRNSYSIHHATRRCYSERAPAEENCAEKERTFLKRPSPTEQARQNHEIMALKRDLLEQRKLIDMLLVLVDPEDVKAALELKRIVRPTASQLENVGLGQPRGLDDDLDDERPW